MQVKLDKAFEKIFKSTLNSVEWQQKNAELHGETFNPHSKLDELAEDLLSEIKWNMGIGFDVSSLKVLTYVLDWDKFPFTGVFWGKIVDKAAALSLKESKKSKGNLKESSATVYDLCDNIERSIMNADRKGEISHNIRYKSIDCNYPFDSDYVVFTYESQEAAPGDIIAEIEPLLAGWVPAVQREGAAGIKLVAFERGYKNEAETVIVGESGIGSRDPNEDPSFVFDNCIAYIEKLLPTIGGEVYDGTEEGSKIYSNADELGIFIEFHLDENNQVHATLYYVSDNTVPVSEWAVDTFEEFVQEFNTEIDNYR